MEWTTANSYKNWTIDSSFEENGKMYANVSHPCAKCGGYKRLSWTNVDDGWCWDCNGTGVERKVVRLYNAKQKEQMDKANARAAERKDEQKKARADGIRADWMERNGFTSDGNIYIAVGNTYASKDLFKEHGYRFDKMLGWHGAANDFTIPEDCSLITFSFEDLVNSENEYGYCYWKDDVEELIKAATPKKPEKELPESNWLDYQVKERFHNLKAVLTRVFTTDGFYGTQFCYTFNVDNNDVIWWTTKALDIKEGDEILLTGTVKEFKEYRNRKQTAITRAIVSPIG